MRWWDSVAIKCWWLNPFIVEMLILCCFALQSNKWNVFLLNVRVRFPIWFWKSLFHVSLLYIPQAMNVTPYLFWVWISVSLTMGKVEKITTFFFYSRWEKLSQMSHQIKTYPMSIYWKSPPIFNIVLAILSRTRLFGELERRNSRFDSFLSCLSSSFLILDMKAGLRRFNNLSSVSSLYIQENIVSTLTLYSILYPFSC